MKLLPIGTAIEYQGIPLTICGYTLYEDTTIKPSYRVVVSPLGFINANSIRLVPINEDIIIIKEGYINELFENYSATITKRFSTLNGLKDSDFEKINNALGREVEI